MNDGTEDSRSSALAAGQDRKMNQALAKLSRTITWPCKQQSARSTKTGHAGTVAYRKPKPL